MKGTEHMKYGGDFSKSPTNKIRETRSEPINSFAVFYRVFLLALTFIIPSPSHAKIAVDESSKTQVNTAIEAWVSQKDLSLSYLKIAVVTVRSVNIETWEKSLPPLPVGRLKIEKNIRGQAPETVHFVPVLYGLDAYKISPEEPPKWKGMELKVLVGKKWIMVINGIDVVSLHPYSEELGQYISHHMEIRYMSDGILGLLFLLIILISLIPRKIIEKLGNKAPVLLLLGQLVLFGLYEWGTPIYYNIRSDLLIIIPAIAIFWIRVPKLLEKPD